MLTSEHDPFVAHFDDRPLLPLMKYLMLLWKAVLFS